MLRRRPAALSGGGGGRGGGRGPRSAASPLPHGPRRGGASRGHRLGGAAASGAGWEESLPGAAGAFGGRFGAGLPRAAAAAAKFARTTGGERGGAGRNGGQSRGGGCTAHPGGRGLRGVRGERRWRAVPGELRRSRHRGRPSAFAVSSAGVCRGVSAPPRGVHHQPGVRDEVLVCLMAVSLPGRDSSRRTILLIASVRLRGRCYTESCNSCSTERSEIGAGGAEISMERPEIGAERPESRTEGPEFNSERSEVSTERPEISVGNLRSVLKDTKSARKPGNSAL